jgi:hypothetical protein
VAPASRCVVAATVDQAPVDPGEHGGQGDGGGGSLMRMVDGKRWIHPAAEEGCVVDRCTNAAQGKGGGGEGDELGSSSP